MEQNVRSEGEGVPSKGETIEWVPAELREEGAADESAEQPAGETAEWATVGGAEGLDARRAPAEPAGTEHEPEEEADGEAAPVAGPLTPEPDPDPAPLAPEQAPVAAPQHEAAEGVRELLESTGRRLDSVLRSQEELSARVADLDRLEGAPGDRVAELAAVVEDLAGQLDQIVGAERLARKRAIEELSGRLSESLAREAEERRRLGDRLIGHCDDSVAHVLESSRHEAEQRRWLQDNYETRLAGLETAVEHLGRILSEVAERPAPAPESPPPVTPPPAASVPPPEEIAAPRGADLNALRFEELRAVGLSITQASRLLATRERLGGFTSLDQLDQVPGFPKDLRERLKAELTVAA